MTIDLVWILISLGVLGCIKKVLERDWKMKRLEKKFNRGNMSPNEYWERRSQINHDFWFKP